jgi:hypothetical protein
MTNAAAGVSIESVMTLLADRKMSAVTRAENETFRKTQAKIEEARDAALAVIEHCLMGYQLGDVPFGKLIQYCHDVLAVEHIPDFARWKILGQAIEHALAMQPRKRGRHARRGSGLWLAEISHGLVRLAHELEGLPLSRAGNKKQKSAFVRAAEVMVLRGIKNSTPVSVEKQRAEWTKYLNSRTSAQVVHRKSK